MKLHKLGGKMQNTQCSETVVKLCFIWIEIAYEGGMSPCNLYSGLYFSVYTRTQVFSRVQDQHHCNTLTISVLICMHIWQLCPSLITLVESTRFGEEISWWNTWCLQSSQELLNQQPQYCTNESMIHRHIRCSIRWFSLYATPFVNKYADGVHNKNREVPVFHFVRRSQEGRFFPRSFWIFRTTRISNRHYKAVVLRLFLL